MQPQPILGLQMLLDVVNAISGNRRPNAITTPTPPPNNGGYQDDEDDAPLPQSGPPVIRSGTLGISSELPRTVDYRNLPAHRIEGGGGPTAPQPQQIQPQASFMDNVGGFIGGSLGGVPGMIGSGVQTALTAPQAAVIEDQGRDMYAYVTGQHDQITRIVDENLPFRRKLFEWAARNPEKVKNAYEQGYWDRDKKTKFTGGRAVWESYARDNLTGASPQSIAVGLVTDPWNALPAIGRIGQGTRALGTGVRAAVAEDAARAAMAARSPTGIGTVGEELVLRATDDLLSGDPARVRAVLESISPDLAVQVEAGTFPLSNIPGGVQGLARASAMQQLRRQVGTNATADRVGRGLELLGRGIETPARLLDEAPMRGAQAIGGGIGRAMDATPGVRTAKSRVASTVGGWFDASPQAQAVMRLNAILHAKGQRDTAVQRQRELISLLGPQVAASLSPSGTRFTDLLDASQRTLADAENAATAAPPAAAAAPSPPAAAPPTVAAAESATAPRKLPGRVIEVDDNGTTRYAVQDRETGEATGAIYDSYWEARDAASPGAVSVQARLAPADETAEPVYRTRPRFLDAETSDEATAPAAQPSAGDDLGTVAVAEEAPPAAAPTSLRSTVAGADKRVREKFAEFSAGTDERTQQRLAAIFDRMNEDFTQLRNESAVGDRIRQRANHADFWRYEFEAENDARAILREAGLPEPEHVNREVGGLARSLDDLAWGDETTAAAARDSLEAILARAEPDTVAPAIQRAIDDAEEFRGGGATTSTETLPLGEEIAETPQATLFEEPAQESGADAYSRLVREIDEQGGVGANPDLVRQSDEARERMYAEAAEAAPRPAAPTAEDSARASLSLPPSANGYTDVPLAEIQTDPTRFQPRSQLSRDTVDQIVKEWDWARFDPVVLWRDPDNRLFMLKGHHRLAAAQQRGDIEAIPARIMEGTEDEAISFARASNDQRPESPLERAATVRREFDRAVAANNGGILGPDDEGRLLARIDLPGVKPTERQDLLNLSRLPGTIRDNLAVHGNAGKAVLKSHAKLGSRIDEEARPRGNIQTVKPQEAEALYRTMQKQKRKRPDDPLPDLSGADIDRLVDRLDAMTGMSRTEQVGLFAGMVTDDGRAASFVTALEKMAQRHKELLRRQTTHERSLKLLESDVTALRGELAALGDDGWDADLANRISEKHGRYEAMVAEVDEARAALTEAQLEGVRLANNAPRDDDTTEYLLSAMILPPPDDVIAAIRGGGEAARKVWDWRDEAMATRATANAVAAKQQADLAGEIARTPGAETGPIIAPEVDQTLGQRFTANTPAYNGRTYGEVADEIERRIVKDKTDLMRLLGQATGQLGSKDTALLNKLQRRYRGVTNLGDVAKIDVQKALRAELRTALNQELGVKDATGLGKLLDRMSTGYSAINLLMPWTLGRYYLGNMMGDSWQIMLAEGPVAVGAANDPGNIIRMTQYAMRGGDPLHGALGDLVKQSGLGGYHPRLITENLAESIISSETTAVRRAGGRARFNWVGDALASQRNPVHIARNLVNGMEWGHRTGLWGYHYRRNLINAKPEYVEEMADTALRHGINADELMQIMDLKVVIDGAQVADTFTRLAISRGRTRADAIGFGEEMGRKWASKVYQSDQRALDQVDDSLFSYAQTNADATLRRVIPFHWWMSRAIPFYAEQMLRHPGFAHAYYRSYAATREQAEAEGWPDSLKRFLKVWEGPGGMMLMLNPLAAMGLLDSFVESDGGYTEENISAIGSVLNGAGEYGFGLLPWWGAMLNHLGYLGDTPFGLDPIGLHQTRNFVGGILQFAAGEGWLGADHQRLLSKPYEQALRDVRDKLSGIGLPGSYHIAANDPNAMPAVQIRNIMLRRHLEDQGLDLNQYMMLGLRAQEDASSPEAAQLEEINDHIASEELDNGPLYRAAVQDYSRANVGVLGANAIIPGPKRVRQEEQLAIQSLSRALNLPIREGGTSVVGGGLGSVGATVSGTGYEATIEVDTADAEFARRWKERFGESYREGDLERMRQAAMDANQLQNAPAESAPLLSQNAAYHALGSEKARKRLDIYNDIYGGRRGVKVPKQGVDLTQAEVARLSEEERGILANAWLDAHDDDGEAETLRNLRDLYAETHPEYGTYQQWAKGTREQWGSASAFRAAAVRDNPNYAEFIRLETNKLRAQGLTPSQILDELDRSSLGLNAYMAYQGLRSSRYDPMPRERGVPLPVASEGAPVGALGGGGQGSWTDWDTRVRTAITETDMAVRIANKFTGTNVMQVPPEWRASIFAMPTFPAEGVPPEDAWIYEDYLNFYREQEAAGGDTSVDAFIAFTMQEFGGPANPSVTAFEPNTWPPVAIAS